MADKLITKITTVEELHAIAAEAFLNVTSKVTKITDESVVSAHLFAIAKLQQKALKDIAVLESRIFPDSANGSYLDSAADLFGVKNRLHQVGSSTYLKIKADAGTEYFPGVHKFISQSGIQFTLKEQVTVGVNGFSQVQVSSIETGTQSNVPANTITSVSPKPPGHIGCTNEYAAVGGVDDETDANFRLRIKNHPNLISKSTINQVLQMIQEVDDRVMRVINAGVGTGSKIEWRLVTRNGTDLSDSELANIIEKISNKLSLSDVSKFGNVLGVELKNIVWHEVNLDFRVDVFSSYDLEDVRKNIQNALTKYFDFNFWVDGSKVQWDDLLDIVKNVDGVKYVPDEFFFPNSDAQTRRGTIPRVTGFIMRDLDNNVLFTSTGVKASVFYG